MSEKVTNSVVVDIALQISNGFIVAFLCLRQQQVAEIFRGCPTCPYVRLPVCPLTHFYEAISLRSGEISVKLVNDIRYCKGKNWNCSHDRSSKVKVISTLFFRTLLTGNLSCLREFNETVITYILRLESHTTTAHKSGRVGSWPSEYMQEGFDPLECLILIYFPNKGQVKAKTYTKDWKFYSGIAA